jgi:hypothetical protein
MNDNIKIGADIHAGDGGYSIGTQEKYDEFVKGRNQSLANMRIRELKEQAMEWVPNMADPDTKIRLLNAGKFADLIVWECMKICEDVMKKDNTALACWSEIKGTFRS